MTTSAATSPALATSQPAPARPPLLQNGDHLTAAEFERRYSAMPNVKAELIEGVVYMASPVRGDFHGRQSVQISRWIGEYADETPGVVGYGDSTVRLDRDNTVQPDAFLMIKLDGIGQSSFDSDGYLQGGPEFVVEISASTVSYDLHEKLRAYRRNGVLEYVVWRVEDDEIDWFILKDGKYVRQESNDGKHRSIKFPGLWMDAKALIRNDSKANIAYLREGLASPEHGAFVERLAANSKPKEG
ncbi:MAG: Uma2 family endonuclease [Gemmataceae bacterium]|nr:Uma2 family endonuclease [Gemmataceae bacterium]